MDQADATVLVVEDFDMVRNLILRRLLIAGYQRAYAVATVREALTWLNHEPVDVLVMDINLPAGDVFVNGCEAGIAIARRWPLVKLLFISGHDRPALVGRCPEDIPLVEKPFVSEELLSRIAETLMLPPWEPPEEWP